MDQESVGQQVNSASPVHEKGDTVLSLAVHELRTPMSIVKWYTEMLLDGDAGPLTVDQTKYLRTIQISNQRAIDLIKSLLNVSRLDLGTFSINPEETDLSVLVKQVLVENKFLAEEKNVSIEEFYGGEIPGILPSLLLDKQICLLILRNIISNAVLFSKEGGIVKISVQEAKQDEELAGKKLCDDSLVVSVIDSGIGIPDEDREKIFSKLFQASNVTTESAKGSGLGLYITQTILSKVGGCVWFTSTKDVGSTFYVAFPKHGMPKKEGRTTLD